VTGCGSSHSTPTPTRLSQLGDVQLDIFVDYTPPQPPPTPGAIVALTYVLYGPCPMLNLTATLDGVPLAFSPNVSGQAGGDSCLVGYYLTQQVAPAPQSVLAISDGTSQTSLTATRLIEPRGLATSWPDGGAVHAGDVIMFAWSTSTDTIALTDAYLYGTDGGAQQAATQVTGTTVAVTVPQVPAGPWTLATTVMASVPIVQCAGAASCTAEVSATTDLAVTAP
jgi:hypothetical protein